MFNPFKPLELIETEVFMSMPDKFRKATHSGWSRPNRQGNPIECFIEGPSFDRDGNLVCWWGRTGAGPDEFFRPQSLMVRDGVLYVADACNHRLKRYDLSDRPSPDAPPRQIDMWGQPGGRPGELGYPYGIDFLSDGNVVVVEYQNARVQLFTPDGRWVAAWGSPGFEPGMLNGPWAVVVDSKDRVSVIDSNNHRVQRFEF